MSVTEILVAQLAAPLAKFLLKRFLQEPYADITSSLTDMAKGKVTDYIQRRETERHFQGLSEKIVTKLEPFFTEEEMGQASVEAVAIEISRALEGRISASFFLEENLNPERLTTAFNESHPLQVGIFNSVETALYYRGLEITVRYLVDICSQMPKFDIEVVASSLKRLGNLNNKVDAILESTLRMEKRVEEFNMHLTSADKRARRYEADYRGSVIRNLDFVELFGADIRPESSRQSLSVAYVSLNLQSADQSHKSTSMPVHSVLRSLSPGMGRLLIRGEAGSGKSTLFRWAGIQAAAMSDSEITFIDDVETPFDYSNERENLQRTRNNWTNKVPFLLRMRDWPDGSLPSPEQFTLQVAREIGNPPVDWVKNILLQGRAIVLFDGVDEIPKIQRDSLKSAIRAIIGTYPRNYYLISTRPAAVPPDWLAELKFREASVDPMSEYDKFVFIDKWHEAVGRELENQGVVNVDMDSIAKDLKSKLPLVPSISRLATNPLLCAMICAIHRERNRNLPQTQTELCEVICHMLLHRREQESKVPIEKFSEDYRSLSYEHKRSIIRSIAHYMVRNGESSIDMVRATHVTREAISGFAGFSKLDSGEVLKALIERSGVLRENRPSYVDFIHNTIKDYLAAERYVESGDIGALASVYHDGDMQQVILFAAGSRNSEFSKNLIIRILEPEKKPTADELHNRRLFALRCMSMSIYRDEELDGKLKNIEESLFPPSNMLEASALATMEDDAIKYLHYNPNLAEAEVAASARALRLIGSKRAVEVLGEYFVDHRRSVVSEIAHNVNPLLVDFVVSQITSKNSLEKWIKERIRDLSPLQGNYKIEDLDLRGTQVVSLSSLKNMLALRRLNISGLSIKNIDIEEGMPSLEILIGRKIQIDDMGATIFFPGLKYLDLLGSFIESIDDIKNLTCLEYLDLEGTNIKSLECIRDAVEIKHLDISNTEIEDLGPIKKLRNLEALHIRNTKVESLDPLKELKSLTHLTLSYTEVQDLSPLKDLPLRTLDVRGISAEVPKSLSLTELISRK